MGDFGFNVLSKSDDDDDEDEDIFDDDEEDEESSGEETSSYRVTYEIVFNDEDEQKKWYGFINFLKKKYPDDETISERIIKQVEELMNEEGA